VNENKKLHRMLGTCDICHLPAERIHPLCLKLTLASFFLWRGIDGVACCTGLPWSLRSLQRWCWEMSELSLNR
jgi:hypothetical protein